MPINAEKILTDQNKSRYGEITAEFRDGWWHVEIQGNVTGRQKVTGVGATLDGAMEKAVDVVTAKLRERIIRQKAEASNLSDYAEYVLSLKSDPELEVDRDSLTEHLADLDKIEERLTDEG